MAEEELWPIKKKYAEAIGCLHWPYPILKGWIPCRFPLLRLSGKQPCEFCWRKMIEDELKRRRKR